MAIVELLAQPGEKLALYMFAHFLNIKLIPYHSLLNVTINVTTVNPLSICYFWQSIQLVEIQKLAILDVYFIELASI